MDEITLSWWAHYKNHVLKVVLNNAQNNSEKVSYWHNAVFCNILTYLAPLSVIALIPSVYMAFMNGVPVVGFTAVFAFLSIVIITLSPGIKLEIRKSIFIFVLYCLSLTHLYYLPFAGPGLLFSLTVTIFSSLIYSSSAAYYSAVINTLICICFAFLISFRINIPISLAYNLGSWMAISSNLVLLSFACAKCLDFLLAGLTAALKDNEVFGGKFEKANRLYKFISQINQSIVHTKDEATLYQKICDIAYTIGKFKMAWIGKFDHDNNKILLTDQIGIPEKSLHLFSAYYENNGPQDYILHSGSYYVCNNIENDLELESWKPFAALNGIRSCLILPIKKEGVIIGSLNLYATEINFFDEEEIALLEEAIDDISFALDVFEKERKHKVAEDIIIKNENRFSALIEKSTDMKTLAGADGKLFFASPSTSRVLGYTLEDFINTSPADIIHPDDIAIVFENIQRILQTEGSSFNSQHRLKHKNGNYIWCEGTMTNLLHEPHLNAIVSNFRDISERKEMDKKREFEENNLNALINSTKDLMWSVDLDFNLISSNSSFNEMGKINFGKAILKGENVLSASFTPEMFKHFKQQYERAFTGEIFSEIEHFEVPFEFWTEISYYPIRNGDEIIGTACYSRDITIAKKSELELENINNRFLLATDSAQMAIWDWDIVNNYLNWDERMYTLYNIGEKEFGSVYEGWTSRLHEEDRANVEQDIQNAITGKKEYHTDFRIVWPDSSVHYIKATGIIERDALGKAIRMIGVNWDITEIKKNEEKLKKSEIFNRSLINSITAHIAVVDEHGTIVTQNNAWEQFGIENGVTTMERIAKGSNYFNVCEKAILAGDTTAGPMLQGMKDILNEKQNIFNLEYPCHSPTEKRWFGVRVMKFEGKERLIITLHTDITDRKKVEDEKDKITKDLIQRNKNLEQFSYIVSHNLRAPVANILGFAELMKYEKSNTGLILDSMKGMADAAQNLDKVIKDMNEILQIRTFISENRQEVYFQDMVEDISLSIGNIIKKENVVIITDFKSIEKMISIKAYLYSIFYNFIINSIKFHKPGVRPLIEIKSIQTNNGLQLIFKDNGMGIDLEKHQHNLFGLYKRFHLEVEGKGMGMFMVKTQVETLGGKISVTSEVNKGTEFTLEFENNN